jgi:hypothetical protein
VAPLTQQLRNRKDHWLPQCYLRGFIAPSRASREKPLHCFFKETQEWDEVSTAEIGYDKGFYDYAVRVDASAVTSPDSAFARLEREFPLQRDAMAANSFANWQEHKQFLCEFMEMLPARSPLGMQHFEFEARRLRGATVLAVGDDRRTITVDSLEMRPLPEHAVRNFTVSTMLQKVTTGQGWATKLDWCLRYADVEREGFCTTDQAIIVEGSLQSPDTQGRVSEGILCHPDTLIFFPLCWQACLFGSPCRFDKAYDRALPADIATLRSKQKQYATRFVASPVIF